MAVGQSEQLANGRQYGAGGAMLGPVQFDGVDSDRDVLSGGQVRGVGSQSSAFHQPAAVHQNGGDERSGDYRGGHGASDPASPDDPEGGRVRT
ncbi:MAG: hypothetical protein ABIZ05_17435 [Pseudonocardiaceae bacterium]